MNIKSNKTASFKDHLGRLWVSCKECEVGYKTQCVYSAKRKPNKGFCIQGRLRKKGENDRIKAF